MREPAFWWRSPSWMSSALAPAGLVYGLITGRRMQLAGHRAPLPVICVGNYSLGGAGKTPAVIALAKLLQSQGEAPVVLSRGYGGRLGGPLQVDQAEHVAADIGDEPLLLARAAPVIVARDRVAGAEAARRAGATVIVMDDGFQNPSLHKDLCVVVIDGDRGVGNGQVFPAGPMRAPLATQIGRTDVLLISGEGNAANDIAAQVAGQGGIVLRSRITADSQAVASLRGERVLAFAGIGNPQRFFATLAANGIEVAASRAFPDHHPFTRAETEELLEQASKGRLRLVTTEKDLVRLPGLNAVDAAMIKALPIALVIEDETKLRDVIAARLKKAREANPPS